jgi:lipoprotein LprG
MSSVRGRLVLLIPVLCLLLAGSVLTACDGDGGGGGGGGAAAKPAFDAADTLRRSSAAMANLKSAAFTLGVEGKPPIMVQGGDLKLLRAGDAEGTLKIEQSGQVVEMQVVALADAVYLKAVTGGWRQVPKALVAAWYDPSAVLDPQRGISRLLGSVTQPRAEATEKVGGREARRVGVVLPKAAIGGLVPGINSDVRGQVWVGAADHRLLKVRGEIPPAAEGGDKGAVVITFTEFDAPYSIKAPA